MQAAEPYIQHLLQNVQEAFAGVQTLAESAINSQGFQDLLQAAMQQWIAAASCAASLALLLATIAAGWVALWHTTMKDVGFFREIMGLNKPKPNVKAARQAEMAAEIERIKRQHSRSSTRSLSSHSRQSASRPA